LKSLKMSPTFLTSMWLLCVSQFFLVHYAAE